MRAYLNVEISLERACFLVFLAFFWQNMKCTTHNQKIEKSYIKTEKKIKLTTKNQSIPQSILIRILEQKQPFKTIIEFKQPITKTR